MAGELVDALKIREFLDSDIINISKSAKRIYILEVLQPSNPGFFKCLILNDRLVVI